VVLRAESSAYDAARAMFDNHIGAVLVSAGGELAGIVTDRDVALRAGSRLTLDRIPLREVMTANPASLDVDSTLGDVGALMLGRRVRRVVVTRGGEPAGLISLDDLVLAPGMPREFLAEIVRAQLQEPAPAKPEGATRPARLPRKTAKPARRSREHRAQTLSAFGAKLRRITGLANGEALAAFEVLASNLVRRLTPGEAKDFAAQLPADVRAKLSTGTRPDRHITRGSIERELASRLGVEPAVATELVWRLGQHLDELVSEGEVEDMAGQLPRSLKALFRHAA